MNKVNPHDAPIAIRELSLDELQTIAGGWTYSTAPTTHVLFCTPKMPKKIAGMR